MAAPLTPKPRSGGLRKLYKQLGKVLDAPSLVVLLYSALDRKRLESIYNKYASRKMQRAQALDREDLVGAVAGWFLASVDVGHAVIRDLDRACKKERHIVASLPNGQIAERLEHYAALEFRRERSKLVWALLRDDRQEAQDIGASLVVEMVSASQGEQSEVEQGEPSDDRDLAMRQRLETYESMMTEARGRVKGLQGQVAQLEKERAELMVTVGRKENALRAEEQKRRLAEESLQKAEKRVREQDAKLESLDPEELKRLARERDRLAQRLRRMEKKGGIELKYDKLRQENSELKQRIKQLEQGEEEGRAERQTLLQTLAVRDRATQDRVVRLRDALKNARKIALQAKEEGESPKPVHVERVGIFVDAANVGASAARAHSGRFDYSALLDLIGDRNSVVAIAYVVDNGQEGFEGFAGALRELGYTVKIKRPAKRPDGTVKADWDMAMAMDIIEMWQRLDTIILASGDGDFVPLVRRLKRWRRRVEVAAFDHAIHPELRSVADVYWQLSENFIL